MIVNQHRMPLTAVCQHGRVTLRAELFCNLRKLLMEVERVINVIMKWQCEELVSDYDKSKENICKKSLCIVLYVPTSKYLSFNEYSSESIVEPPFSIDLCDLSI